MRRPKNDGERLAINTKALRRFVAAVFRHFGTPEPFAKTAAEVLVFADERGIDSHGVTNLERVYVERIRRGAIKPSGTPAVCADEGAITVLDAGNGLGLVAGTIAIDLAVSKARRFGLSAVAVRGSSHFGAASFYTMRAQRSGVIAIACSNLGGQAIARPPSGSRPLVGTNPISIAAPSENLPPFALDMSTTVVSTGRLRKAMREGQSIPAGWLTDDAGNPVTDPRSFFEGRAHLAVLGGSGETGGHKGFGLALAVDILAGLLPGAAVGAASTLDSAADRGADQNVGHFFLAIDVAHFRPIATFRRDLDLVLGAVLATPQTRPDLSTMYAGYAEAKASDLTADGTILLSQQDVADLKRLGESIAVTFPSVSTSDEQVQKGRQP
jgi:LDH2 family malate/lactate/ureidoglycolate dehydrogenase